MMLVTRLPRPGGSLYRLIYAEHHEKNTERKDISAGNEIVQFYRRQPLRVAREDKFHEVYGCRDSTSRPLWL